MAENLLCIKLENWIGSNKDINTKPKEEQEKTRTMNLHDLPHEIIYTILEKLSFKEKHTLKTVCNYWKDCLQRMITYTKSSDISQELGLSFKNGKGEFSSLEEYDWAINILDNNNEYIRPSLIFGKEILNYSFGLDNIGERCEYWNANDSSEDIIAKRVRWAYECLERQIGIEKVRLFQELRRRIWDEIIYHFNELYPLDIKLNPDKFIPLISIVENKEDIYLDFVINGYIYNREQGWANYHNFKMNIKRSAKGWVWSGLGDEWENMCALDIIKQFFKTEGATGKGVSLKEMCTNTESNTISHLFEAIFYLVMKSKFGETVKWKI